MSYNNNLQDNNAELRAILNTVNALPSGGASNTDAIPSYWQAHIEEKVAEVKALQAEGGRDCFSFIFITDTHYPSNLGKRSPALAKKIMDECKIRLALNGGDSNTRGCYQTKGEILVENEAVEKMFAPINDRLLQIEGNHDGSYYWSGGTAGSGTSYSKQFTEQEMFEEYYRANGLNRDVHFDVNSNAFYYDDVSNKVRYIGLNTMNVPNEKTDVNEDGTAKYNKFRSYQFLQDQYDFLCNDALASVPNDSWSVVVFGHSGIYDEGDFAVMIDVLSAYKDKKSCVAEYAGTASGVAYKNLAEPLPDNTTDTSKWVNGYRFSSSGISAQSGTTLSNEIPVKFGDVIRVKGVTLREGADRWQFVTKQIDGTEYAEWQYFNVNMFSGSITYLTYEGVENGIYTYRVTSDTYGHTPISFRIAFPTPTNASDVIITVNQEIKEGGRGYDAVSVNHDFTNAKGKFIAYFHGHDHIDAVYTRDSIKDITTRCDAKEENTEELRNERVEGTITEQSFDVFTVNKKTRKIYATKIGAGDNREIGY